MSIELFRTIGKSLLHQLSSAGKFSKRSLGTGASGDATYQIDKLAEDIVLSGLQESGESFTVISEEAGIVDIRGGGRKVLIDPVDGSRNAVSGIPFYCTSIAVAEGNTIGDIVAAYVVNLVNGDEFWAERGKGAFKNGEQVVTQQDDILHLAAYEAQAPHKDIPMIIPLLSESRKTRCLGATALDLSYLAAGSISVFANPSPSRSFDFAGGWLLIKEAGGIFTDIRGKPVDPVEVSLRKSTSLLASGNARLHEKALRLLNKSGRSKSPR